MSRDWWVLALSILEPAEWGLNCSVRQHFSGNNPQLDGSGEPTPCCCPACLPELGKTHSIQRCLPNQVSLCIQCSTQRRSFRAERRLWEAVELNVTATPWKTITRWFRRSKLREFQSSHQRLLTGNQVRKRLVHTVNGATVWHAWSYSDGRWHD